MKKGILFRYLKHGTIVVLACMLFLISLFTGCFEEQIKKNASDFTLIDTDGTTFSLSDYRGKIVVINFLATWCLPCKEEMPELTSFYEKHHNTITMISIDTDVTESVQDLTEFKQAYNATWIFALDTIDEDVSTTYDITMIPTTFIIDNNGVITYTHVGPIKETELMREIEKINT